MLGKKSVSGTCRSSKSAVAVVAELLEDRRLLAAWLTHGVLTVTGTNAADAIRVRDDGTTPGQIAVQLNKKTIGTFDRRVVRSIRIDGGRGNDSIVANFAAGAVKGRRLWVANNAATGKDSLTVSGNATSLNGTYVSVNRNSSVFSQKAPAWLAYDGADPVAWATKRVVRGIFQTTAAVPSSLRTGNLDTAPEAVDAIQTSYAADPISVGQTIQAENFDRGGQGISYFDTSAVNFGDGYRTAEAIDIQRVSDVGGGYYVGWTKPGEWMEYMIAVPETGLYDLTERVAIYGSSGRFHVEIDGVDKTGYVGVPRTGGWQQWTSITQRGISLEAGQHVLRLAMDAAGSSEYVGNFNWLRLKPATPYSPSELTAVPFSSNEIALTWSDNSDNESGFAIERKLGAEGAWELIAMADANATGYTDGGLYAGEEYTYRVAATNARGNSAATTQAATSIPAVLIPGSGWTGPTPEPAPIGDASQAGYDAKAIARWDVVPYQTFTTDFAVGIPAFHMNGIDRVEFSVDNGPWVAVREMTLNPQSNVVEYWTMLKASAFAKDGPVEVRAVAYPKVGEPRVLDSLQLFANNNGTLTSAEFHVSPSRGNDANPGTADQPFATLKQALRKATDGATIILDEIGRYDTDRSAEASHTYMRNTRWVTIRPADGLMANQVILIGTAGTRSRMTPGVDRVCFQRVSFDWSTYIYVNDQHTWYDQCSFFDPNGFEAAYTSPQTPFWNHNYVTDSSATKMGYGFAGVDLVRNSTVTDVCDAFQNSHMVINCRIESIVGSIAAVEHHPDVFQYFGDHDNEIVYGVTGRNIEAGQVFFVNQPLAEGRSMRNTAFVSVDIEYTSTLQYFSQLQGALQHVLFQNVCLAGQRWMFRTDMTDLNCLVAKDVVFQDSTLHPMTMDQLDKSMPAGIQFVDCGKVVER